MMVRTTLAKRMSGGVGKTIAALLFATAGSSIAVGLGDGKVHIYAVECGQGSGSIVIGPAGTSLMIDGGATNGKAANFIEAMDDAIAAGLTDSTLDYTIVSHFHSDHLMAFDEVYAEFPGGFDGAYDRTGSYSSGAYTTYNNLFGSSGLNKRLTPATFSLDGATLTYLGRGGATSSNENSYGVVYRLDYGVFQAWFGGDLGDGFEEAHGVNCGLVEFYHVNHHGSSTSSEEDFLDLIQPIAHVFSYQPGNSYGHPTTEAADRLDTIGSARYDTPYDGYGGNPYILVESDGGYTFTVNGDSYDVHEPPPTPTPTPTPSPSPSPVPPPTFWINEIHYDNSGGDTNEGVEVAGTAGEDLTGMKLVAYNGGDNQSYSTVNLTGTVPNEQAGWGTLWFNMSGLQNGAPDGVALISSTGTVIQFLSYEGSFTASNGPASGVTSTDIGVSQAGTAADTSTMQLQGTGHAPGSFTWNAAATSTRGSKNTSQTFN